jgi:hypothetical protein
VEKLSARLSLGIWWLTAVQAIVSIGVLAIFWKHLPPQVPLLYSLPWGQDQLVSPYYLWLIPTFSILLGLLANVFGERILKDNLLRSLFFGTILITQFILCLSLIRIVLLII